ncbi:hypothetical protein I4F81_005594 [Pyropia yezoensis]|uniref:Uncharacterized protein n=1 Tax=Pyropia yezoensis TaxID=2788 RepID=A0ACC3BYC0_PYRYE|nr:hypothetical protein I4F81_005594 [Neopyropia yezoensis]
MWAGNFPCTNGFPPHVFLLAAPPPPAAASAAGGVPPPPFPRPLVLHLATLTPPHGCSLAPAAPPAGRLSPGGLTALTITDAAAVLLPLLPPGVFVPPAEAVGAAAAAAVDPAVWPLIGDVKTVAAADPPLLVVRVCEAKAGRYLRARVEAVRTAGAAAAAAAGAGAPPMAWADAAAVVADVVGGVWGDRLRGWGADAATAAEAAAGGGMTAAERRAYDDLAGGAPPPPPGPPAGAAAAKAAAAKARAPPKRSAAAAALGRVDRTGMRSMRSYFGKKA